MSWDTWSFIIGVASGIGFLLALMGICCCMVASRCERNEDEARRCSEIKGDSTGDRSVT